MTFQEQIAALPEKERASFFRSIFAICEAGRQAGVSAEDWGSFYADVYQDAKQKCRELT